MAFSIEVFKIECRIEHSLYDADIPTHSIILWSRAFHAHANTDVLILAGVCDGQHAAIHSRPSLHVFPVAPRP